jgi:hypothetical protein
VTISEVRVGMRVSTGYGLGTVTSDYWRDRNRFTVKLDLGWEADFTAGSLRPAKENGHG